MHQRCMPFRYGPAIAFCSFLVGCFVAAPAERGEGGSTGAGASGGTTSSSSSGGATSGGGGDSEKHCIHPTAGWDLTPTAGTCNDNIATTCAADGTAIETACGADATCTTFVVDEERFANQIWTPARSYEWAACIPNDAPPCSFAPNETPYCDGDNTVHCAPPPLPEYGPDGNATTAFGYFATTSCGPGNTCFAPLEGPVQWLVQLKCLPTDSQPCSSPSGYCSGDSAFRCATGYGVMIEQDCPAAGNICIEDCNDDVLCVPPETTACSPATQPKVCDSSTSYTYCSACTTSVVDCSTQTVLGPNGTLIDVPGQCAVVDGQPQCVAATETLCDPQTTAASCIGDQAVNCTGIVDTFDCATVGATCATAGGRAGCLAPGADTCVFDPFGGECMGDVLETCCDATGINPEAAAPCVPGFLTQATCAQVCVPDPVLPYCL